MATIRLEITNTVQCHHIDDASSVIDTIQRETTLELNHVALLRILRDAGYKIPDGAVFEVEGTSIDFDRMVNVVWTDTQTRSSDADNVADIVGILEDPSLAHVDAK